MGAAWGSRPQRLLQCALAHTPFVGAIVLVLGLCMASSAVVLRFFASCGTSTSDILDWRARSLASSREITPLPSPLRGPRRRQAHLLQRWPKRRLEGEAVAAAAAGDQQSWTQALLRRHLPPLGRHLSTLGWQHRLPPVLPMRLTVVLRRSHLLVDSLLRPSKMKRDPKSSQYCMHVASHSSRAHAHTSV